MRPFPDDHFRSQTEAETTRVAGFLVAPDGLTHVCLHFIHHCDIAVLGCVGSIVNVDPDPRVGHGLCGCGHVLGYGAGGNAGRQAGPRFHARYFQLKALPEDGREQFIKTHRGAYTGYVLRHPRSISSEGAASRLSWADVPPALS